MKYLWILFPLFSMFIFAGSGKFEPGEHLFNRGTYKYPDESLKQKLLGEHLLGEETKQSVQLADIKYAIVNGNLLKAKTLLRRHRFNLKDLEPIRLRYLSIVYFLEQNYEKSLETLNSKVIANSKYDAKVCYLRVLNMIVLDDKSNLNEQWLSCKKATAQYSNQNLEWLSLLVFLKTEDKTETIKSYFKNKQIGQDSFEDTNRLLKMAIYLNFTNKFIKEIPKLNISYFNNEQTLELLGFIYYKHNDLVNAWKFFNKLETVNANNFKGNIYLTQKNYIKAKGHFLLAKKDKPHSKNANYALLFLDILLKSWDTLQENTKMYPAENEDRTYKKLIAIYALIKRKKIAQATKLFKELEKMEQSVKPSIYYMLKSYFSLKKAKQYDASLAIQSACQHNYFESCLLESMDISVSEMSEFIQSESKLKNFENLEIKSFMNIPETKFKEDKIVVNQRLVYELDIQKELNHKN